MGQSNPSQISQSCRETSPSDLAELEEFCSEMCLTMSGSKYTKVGIYKKKDLPEDMSLFFCSQMCSSELLT